MNVDSRIAAREEALRSSAEERMHTRGASDSCMESQRWFLTQPLSSCLYAMPLLPRVSAGSGTCFAQTNFTKFYVDEYSDISGVTNIMKEVGQAIMCQSRLPTNYNSGALSHVANLINSDRLGSLLCLTQIYARGPVAAGIDATVLENYTGGIITATEPSNINHIVSIVGWGHDAATGVDYWIGRNSWGSYWGENGWFRLIRGVDALGIEDMVSWGETQSDISTDRSVISRRDL